MTIQGKSKEKENQREGQACDSTNILIKKPKMNPTQMGVTKSGK